MEVWDSCPLCASEDIKTAQGYERAHLAKCAVCTFVFSSIKPSQEQLIEHYKTYKRGGSISELTMHRYDNLLLSFEAFKKNSTILDVGCGDGYFLERARNSGWYAFGTEFTTEALEVCAQKQLDVVTPDNLSVKFGKGVFDVITAFEVIEHLEEPKKEVVKLSNLLRPGGLCYATTPNFDSLSRLMLREKWNVIEYPEHLSYFSVKTMKLLFESCGFQTISIGTFGFSIERWRSSGEGSGVKSGIDELIRQKAENNLILSTAKKISNKFLDLTKMGDTLKGTFVKL